MVSRATKSRDFRAPISGFKLPKNRHYKLKLNNQQITTTATIIAEIKYYLKFLEFFNFSCNANFLETVQISWKAVINNQHELRKGKDLFTF